MRLLSAIVLFGCASLAPAFAQSVATAPATAATSGPAAVPGSVSNLAAVVVTGVQPGPGLWRVSKGGHVMWILGTLSPLPQGMQWRSQELEQVIGESQQVLLQPSLKFKADVGFFGKLFLLPSAYSARKNENGATLQQVLPPAVYARWEVLKQKYIGRDHGIERWRPIFAGQELYQKALKANGLSRTGGVQQTIDALLKRDGLKPVATSYQVVIENPRAALKAFRAAGPRDVTCFIRTLDSVGQDIPAMKARANAWATGDLQTLKALPDSDRRDACTAALADAGFAHTLGLDDLPAKLRATWLAAARTALQTNSETFAILPMSELLKADGYLSALKADGYSVQAPDDPDDVEPAAGNSATP
jgi:hypothetical protein